MTFLDRYLAGEHEQVWAELRALGADVRREPVRSDARAVAGETMRRVRRNCERIVAKLEASGAVFGVYPDGSVPSYAPGPLTPPSAATRTDAAALDERIGPLPLSLEAFWNEVGSVNFVGMYRSAPDLLDPLVIDPPDGTLEELDNWEEDGGWGNQGEDDPGAPPRFEGGLAPDYLHKDNISGGLPYAVALPEPAADFELLNERHGMEFIPYLRLAILRWGGFPGLDGRDERWELIPTLIEGLEPF